MKRTIFILPFIAALFWWLAAQQPFSRNVSFRQIVQPVTCEPDTLPPGEKNIRPDIASFLANGFRQSLNLPESDSLLLISLREDEKGGRHALVQQLHFGVPVFGAWYNLHEKDGAITVMRGNIHQELKAQTEPVLSEAEALEKALEAFPASVYAWQDEHFEAALHLQKQDANASFFPKGKLVIIPERFFPEAMQESGSEGQLEDEIAFHLAWSFNVFAVEPEMKKEVIFIDATDGKVLHRLPDMAHCHTPAQGKAAYRPGLVEIFTDSCNGPAVPRYRLHDVPRNIEIFDARNTNATPLFGFYNESTLWVPPQADTVAVAAMHGLEIWYDYLANNSNWNWHGLNGQQGQPIYAWVHYGNNYGNAVYNGFLLFGDGDPNGELRSPLVCRDIVAHEATHGLIANTANLLYEYEPGILNEGIADIFACLVELEQGNGNWILGEDIRPGGRRRIDAPNLMGLPDTYRGNYWINQSAPDQALHHNSTVLGHWFYLLAEGGSGTNEAGTEYSVLGIGRSEAANLLFHTMKFHYLNPTDGFFGARRATIEAASFQLAWNQDMIDNLAMAWCAVGVGGCDVQGSDSVALLTPNGGEEFFPDDSIPIEWENTSGVTGVKIIFSANGGASWQEIASFPTTGNSGNRLIPVPDVYSHLCRIRVIALNDPLAFDDSDSSFSIIGCDLLSSFSVTPERGCYGTDFNIYNTSYASDARFVWIVDGQYDYPASPDGFTLLNASPGKHTITLIAKNGACVDTFSRTVQVAPIPSAAFNLSVSNHVVTATAVFTGGEQYFWSVDGQRLSAFDGSQSLSWTAPGPGSYNLCLFVDDDCSIGGVNTCQTVWAGEEVACEGNVGTWEQIAMTNDVRAIAEKGDTLYLATSGGLIEIYDKSTGGFNLYNTANSGLHALPLTSVAVRNNGTVVVGTANCGLAVFDGQRWEAIPVSTPPFWLPSNNIKKIVRSESGSLWILTHENVISGLTKWGVNDEYANFFQNSGQGIYDITSIGNDIFVSTPFYLERVTEEGEIMVESQDNPVFGSNVLRSVTGTDNVLWFSSGYEGIYQYNKITAEGAFSNPFSAPRNYIWVVYSDREGQVWAATDYEACRYNGPEVDIYNFSDGLAGRANVFFQDINGTIWCGTQEGLFRFKDPDWELFKLSAKSLSYFYPNDSWDIEITPQGKKYFVQNNSLFEVSTDSLILLNDYCGNPDGQVVADTLNNLWTNGFLYSQFGPCLSYDQLNYPGPDITSMASWGKYMCFTSDLGLHLLDLFTGDWSLFDAQFLNITPTQSAKLNETKPGGSLWFTNYGDQLVELKRNMELKFHYPPPDYMESNSNFEIAALGKNENNLQNIWLSYRYLFSPPSNYRHKLIFYRYNPNAPNDSEWHTDTLDGLNALIGTDQIHDLKVSPSYEIWIGLSSLGLVRFDPQANTWEIYNKCNSGLPGNSVFSIEFDSEGNVWAATNNGIGILTPSSELIQPSFSHQGEVCQGAHTVFTNTTVGATSWEWRVNGALVSSERNLEFSFPSLGNNIVELTAYNAEGCGVSTSQPVRVHPVANFSGFPENIVDCDASYLLCAPEGMASYEWKKGSYIVGYGQCLNVEQSNSGVFELKITDYCGTIKNTIVTVTLSGTCVYPGDFNNDGIVDYRDLIWFGYSFANFGSARIEQGINWGEYPALDWNGRLPVGANLKHCDADGSGVIDLLDWEAIDLNYLNTHGGYPSLPSAEQSPYAFVPDSVAITKLDSTTYLLNFNIVAQNANGQAINNFYGVGMRIYVSLPSEAELIEAPEFDFNNSSLGTDGLNAKGLVKSFPEQKFMDVAFTRLDHLNQPGVDVIGTASFVVADDHLPIFDSLRFALSLEGSIALTNNGHFIPIGGTERAFTFSNGQVTETREQKPESQITIYPNPTSGRCRLELSPMPVREVAIQVLTMHGTEVWATVFTGQALHYNLDLSELPAGLYLVVVTTEQRRHIRKIVKI